MAPDRQAYALARHSRMTALRTVAASAEAVHDGTWLFELAWDGHRVLAARLGSSVQLVSSDLREWSRAFPAVVRALRAMDAQDFVLEGFVCALDDEGRPSFERLRQRAATRGPVHFVAWDIHRLAGDDLRSLPLVERRKRLTSVLPSPAGVLATSEPLHGSLAAIGEATKTNRMLGVFARRADDPYPEEDGEWLFVPSGDEAEPWARSLSPAPTLTNQAKVFFPRDGFTKKDLVVYYDSVSELLLPLLRERPVIVQRAPDGIDGFSWYQHRVPPHAPDYLPGVWIDDGHRLVLSNREALLWMINQGAVTLHGWSNRVGRTDPDWVALDLDPGDRTPWEDVIEVAVAIRKLLELLELPSVPKTSGQRGLHILVPLAPGQSPSAVVDFARRASQLVVRLMPDKVTVETSHARRAGRLYLDCVQGFVGRSLALPYSVRAADGAPVSAPLAWDEVTKSLDASSLNLRTMRRRIDARGDLAGPLLGPGVHLSAALERLT